MANPFIWAGEQDLSGPGPSGLHGLLMAGGAIAYFGIGFWLAYGKKSPLSGFFGGKDILPFVFSFGLWPASLIWLTKAMQ
jgi:hypothetical protein